MNKSFEKYRMNKGLEIQEQLRALFSQPPFPGSQLIRLFFTYKGHPFNTVFTLSNTEELITFTNHCIKVYFNRAGPELSTSISKNDEDPACFTPRLVSSGDIKTTDVLQVLKTRLSLLFPTEDPHTISNVMSLDIATIEDVGNISLSVNRILRGQDAYYEKYGYESARITPIKLWIRSLSWESVPSEVKDLILPRVSDPIEPGATFVEVMKKIPIEEDLDEEGISLSFMIWGALVPWGFEEYKEDKTHLFPQGSPDCVWTFTLNPESEAWTAWSQTIQFTDLVLLPDSLVAPGKNARKRRTRRKIHNRRNSKTRKHYRKVLN